MSSRLSRMTLLALTASLLLSGPRAMADNVKGSDARAEASDVATEAYAGQALQDPGPALTPDVPEAVLYDNGPLITHPTGGAGGAAASALQTAAGLTVFGFANSISGGFRIADDFTVPAGGWGLQTVRLFNYQTGSGNTSTINNINLQIWNGVPNAAGSVVVFGDATTNRLASSTWSNIYRTLDTDLVNTAPAIIFEPSPT